MMSDGMSGTTAAKELNTQPVYQPRTALGKLLWKIRGQIVASGEPLLGWDAIEREISEKRQGAQAQE
jgi:hypothetical protein